MAHTCDLHLHSRPDISQTPNLICVKKMHYHYVRRVFYCFNTRLKTLKNYDYLFVQMSVRSLLSKRFELSYYNKFCKYVAQNLRIFELEYIEFPNK